ncbi:MAG TPA: hypothetical protein VFJ57_00580 [Solirubrobacterales bacterium]|nr:hypothetical protein [Solirubrobacterales bacterium]
MPQPLDSRIEDLSPADARALLEQNTHNRSMRQDYVRKLAAAMERGEWRENGEPIQIAEDGTLLNGQHRLHAVVKSGVTVPFLVIRGLPVVSQATMDAGLRRNLSDVLALHGENETANLAAMLAMLYRYRNGHRLNNSGSTAPTSQEALALLADEPGIKEGLPLARQVLRDTGLRISVTAVLIYLFDEADPGQGTRFFEGICQPDGLSSGNPIVALRSILERDQRDPTYRLTSYVLFAMVIKAFNAWREGRDVFVLAFKPGTREAFPKILEPAPVEEQAAAEG